MGKAVNYLNDALQDAQEFAAFMDVLRRENVRSYLEVGAKFGGAFWRVGTGLPAGMRMVAVDLPRGTRAWGESEPSLKNCAKDLRGHGQEVTLIWGDSTAPDVIEQVRKLGPFDAILIDANHTLPYVTRDFENYGPMGRIIAFHDIAWHRAPEWGEGIRIDVPQFWESIKGQYRHEEIKLCPTGKNNGIGVLFNP